MATHFDICKSALDEIDEGRMRPLSRTERHSARVVERRLQMWVRRDPQSEVELSPYMKSLLGELNNVGVSDAAHASIAANI